jgi:septum formation protein
MSFKYLRQLATQYQLILGSGSPRRFRLLTEIGIPFRRLIPDLEESARLGEAPYDYAVRLAEEKAVLIAGEVSADDSSPLPVVVGCDTIVLLEDRILQKPVDDDDALRMLSELVGRTHVVCTGVALCARGEILASDFDTTEVLFRRVEEDILRDYVASGEPLDKAGAYGIQGRGTFLVDSIRGHLDNVIGLPRYLLNQLARESLRRLEAI